METINDIVRDVRKKGKYNKENSDIDWTTEEVGDLMLSLADRFETAAKALEADRDNWRRQALDEDARANATHKDSLVVGDMATMRDALESVNKIYDMVSKPCIVIEEVRQACQKARAVLISTTPRNCDVYETKAERQSAFINWYNETFDLKGSKYAIDTCDLKHNIDDILHEYIEWLFAEAKGEAE